jgi:hypothetical protein
MPERKETYIFCKTIVAKRERERERKKEKEREKTSVPSHPSRARGNAAASLPPGNTERNKKK